MTQPRQLRRETDPDFRRPDLRRGVATDAVLVLPKAMRATRTRLGRK